MNLYLKKSLKSLLSERSIGPKKILGQHFLTNKNVFQKIIVAANLKSGDIVLEVGPGTGNLTLELAKRAKKVFAVEKDFRMIEVLKEVLRGSKNVDIVQGDILKAKLKLKNYKIVANIPYYLTSPLIRKFLEEKNPPKEMVLMVQKEVAQRICAKPPEMNLLAVSVQFYAQPKIMGFVAKKYFWPQPKVDSAIIKIEKINKNGGLEKAKFFKIVKAGFSQPRKQILNNLAKGLKLKKDLVKTLLEKNGVRPEQRAETLTIKDWIKLTKTF